MAESRFWSKHLEQILGFFLKYQLDSKVFAKHECWICLLSILEMTHVVAIRKVTSQLQGAEGGNQLIH